ncbi:hypothetical protein ACIHFE_30290 [Streptomyces sp. NPDC052396]|uniref:hypothetical protein n=1 Tax=Streptomyces sp. NPDC052396 TaxID=3365689 RepID=UPI0037D8B15C
MARKREQLAGPQLIDFYLTLGQALDRAEDDPRLADRADQLSTCLTQLTDERGEGHIDDADIEPSLVKLMDTLAFDAAPQARRLIELLMKRGWTGWTKLERVDHTHYLTVLSRWPSRVRRTECGRAAGTRPRRQ